ncbi:uncharacterized protein LOC133304107 [Gastrolobium bilobum]|uniref:uncharacterized protein LOC133304107 n=1 Tax=Gastrolobium bilobum TaxID=150636 RepID=UPI002AAF4C19|nr:uncharacterized protein LOC133304107 [Gastrolobium bilobum]
MNNPSSSKSTFETVDLQDQFAIIQTVPQDIDESQSSKTTETSSSSSDTQSSDSKEAFEPDYQTPETTPEITPETTPDSTPEITFETSEEEQSDEIDSSDLSEENYANITSILMARTAESRVESYYDSPESETGESTSRNQTKKTAAGPWFTLDDISPNL